MKRQNIHFLFLLFIFSTFFVTTLKSNTLISKESIWKYLDDGSDQGTAWTSLDFDDSSWGSGPGKLGYGDDNNNTTLSYGDDEDNKYITTYFRKSFTLDDDPETLDFTINVLRDDGVVVYVNGEEALRDLMGDGDVNYTTLAIEDDGRDSETKYYSFSVSRDLFIQGENVITAEVHQIEASSSDMGFDLELVAEVTNEVALISKESTWKYLDDGSDQGTAWTSMDFDDSNWASGPGKLGYGDDNNNTTLGYGGDEDNKYITTYFRKNFTVNEKPDTLDFTINVLRDDGVVVYVNGEEALRDLMGDGDVDYTTLAIEDDNRDSETEYYSFPVSRDLFIQGENVIAAEIHQVEASSSDMGFDLELVIEQVETVDADLYVKKITQDLAIDGDLDEEAWDISQAFNYYSDGTDNTALFGLLWDEDYLYVGVSVTDNVLVNNHRQVFFDDAINICIDALNNKSASFDTYDYIYGKAIRSFWIQELNYNYDNVIHQYQETENGYTMEFAFPWDDLGVLASSNEQIGFEIVVMDDDTQDNAYDYPRSIIWKSTDGDYTESTENWGTIELSAEEATFSSPYLALLTPNNAEFLIQGKTSTIEWVSGDVDNVKIDYSLDNGANWITFIETMDAEVAHYDWNVDASPTDELLLRISDVSNSSVQDVSKEPSILSAPLTTSKQLIPSFWTNYTYPYDAYYPGDASNACGPSSLARILHSWEFPRQGNGALSFTDAAGTYWSADFGNTIYNYDKMPNILSQDATEEEYSDVATLCLHAYVAMEDYGGSGTDLDNMSYAFNHYFNYEESTPVYMTDYTDAEWTQLLINEIDSGRSMLVSGMNLTCYGDWNVSNSVGGHWYHCDGYNEDGEFHVIVGFGNYQHDGYYKIEEFPLYAYNVGMLIGLQPDLDGKELTLLQPHDGTYEMGSSINITWESLGVTNIQIEYSLDNGLNWNEITNSVSTSLQSYTWTTPEQLSDECKIRITDIDDINVYDANEELFKLVAAGTAIDEYPVDENKEFALSPNPVTTILTLENYSSPNYRIYNILGGLVMESSLLSNSIDVSKLKPGVYILMLDSKPKRFVKE